MKSSHKPSAEDQVFSWQPAEFTKPEESAPKVKAEDILSIFQIDPHELEDVGTAPSAPHRPARHVSTVAWAPEELQPFTPQVIKAQPAKEIHVPQQPAHPEPRRGQDETFSQAMKEKVNQLLAEAHNSRSESLRLMEETRQQVNSLLERTELDAQQRRQEAYELGKGQAEAEYATLLETARQLITEVNNWRVEVLANSEAEVIGMIKDIAAALFGEGMLLDQKVLEEVFARALGRARSMGNLRVFANPKDALRLDADWRDFQVSISGQRIQVIPNETIRPGGCFIEGDQGSVDARIETRLGAVMKVFDNQTEE